MLAGARRKFARTEVQKAPAQADVLKAMLATIEGMSVRETIASHNMRVPTWTACASISCISQGPWMG